MEQLPNFALAAPMLVLVVLAVRDHIRRYPRCWRTLAVHETGTMRALEIGCLLYALGISILALFFVHVEIATRLVATASPAVYWYAAASESGLARRRVCTAYFVSYSLLGVLVHGNFYPWT